jgi:hypothetical protein
MSMTSTSGCRRRAILMAWVLSIASLITPILRHQHCSQSVSNDRVIIDPHDLNHHL